MGVMKVLVTGGSGFIGSSVVDELLKAGHEPVVVDRRVNPWTRKLPVEIHECPVQDIGPISGLDGVIHLAADHIVAESVRDPLRYYNNNLSSLLRAIDLAPDMFVFSSSAAVYGKGTDFSETSPTDPINPYGRTKLWGEEILADAGIRHVSLRYFNAAGAGERHGYIQEPRTHVVPILLDCVRNDSPFTVFGKGLDTRDGTCVRDYTHVVEIAKAHVAALEYRGTQRVMNIGSGRETTLLELIAAVEGVTGKRVRWSYGPARSYDPPRLVADVEKARTELGWRAEMGLQEIVQDAWAWEQLASAG